MFRLVVDASEGLLGWRNGKTLTVPAEGISERMSGRHVVVDVRDMPRCAPEPNA